MRLLLLTTLSLLLGCKDAPTEDPAEACRASGDAECCADDECGEGQICHFNYACREIDGARICDEPTGDRRCHELCGEDTAAPCEDAGEFCQTLNHAQGGDVYDTLSVCF
ncbi:MAG: hypothetical protein RIT28_1299 [Pseudomonadota bacterium]